MKKYFFPLAFAICVSVMNNTQMLARTHGMAMTYDTVRVTEEERVRAFELLEYVEENERWGYLLDNNEMITFPIGIKKTMGKVDCNIIIYELYSTSEGTFCNSYMIITTPAGERLAFKADHMRFSPDYGFLGTAYPQLLGNDMRLLNEVEVQPILKQNGLTAISWDCFTIMLYPDMI